MFRFDPDTGAFIDTFASAGSGGLDPPHGMLQRSGDVLVASFGTDSILHYDRNTCAFLSTFINDSNGLNNPVYIATAPDGNLHISSQVFNEIQRHTPAGVFIDDLVATGHSVALAVHRSSPRRGKLRVNSQRAEVIPENRPCHS